MLEGYLNAADLKLEAGVIQKLKAFVDLFLETSKTLNLTSLKKDEDILIKHIIDSLSVLKHFKFEKSKHVLDLGTGGGLPGIPLAIALPDTEFSLVDATDKKVKSVQHFIESLGLKNARAFQARAEDMGHDPRQREFYDVVLARALAPLNILLELCTPLMHYSGTFIAYKGPNYLQELTKAQSAMTQLKVLPPKITHYSLPEEAGNRVLLMFKKEALTPERYPRRTGIPEKRPL